MKAQVAFLLTALHLSYAVPTGQTILSPVHDSITRGRLVFEDKLASLPRSWPGIDLDLNQRRLVQFEDSEPVWITELEKVSKPPAVNIRGVLVSQGPCD